MTGSPLLFLNVMAEAMIFNDADRSSQWFFQGSFDDINYDTFDVLTSPALADTSPTWKSETVGGLIPLGTGLPDNGVFYIRVLGDDAGGTGSRDEFALNNLSITAVPEPSSFFVFCGLLGIGAVTRTRRPRVAVDVSASRK
ncbi:hypothetical protein [Novipirellula artificiosorum]|uniref:PEP-CTERM protein-sorting domain-containing protein n=1 Tax=Novipirellula artificiosorum TaxID=2528016 RepID=A0A5C6DA86_9BACT|nr:hypothetical protein [Novipirellula artificiosorum]TWU32156.1 hypothetical protein Poly41_56410 [Novipirellula artificiosorum]